MTIVTLEKAQSELPELLARAEAGEEIIISRAERPAVRLALVGKEAETGASKPVRRPGALAHLRGKMPDDLFLTPMSDDELDAWEGKYSFDPEK